MGLGKGIGDPLRGRRKLKRVIGIQGVSAAIDPGAVEPGSWREIAARETELVDEKATTAGIVVSEPEYVIGGDGFLVPNPKRTVGAHTEKAAVDDFLAGHADAKTIEATYKLREGFLRSALVRRYGTIDNVRTVLRSHALENAIVLGEYAMSQMVTMTGAQAMLAAKVSSDIALGQEKAIRDTPKAVDFGALAEIGQTLARLEQIALSGRAGEITVGDGGFAISDDDPVTRE